MEEADVLCSRIGIVNQGVLRCLGTQTRLKTLYGGGFHLSINCKQQATEAADKIVHKNLTDFVKKVLSKAILLRQFNG